MGYIYEPFKREPRPSYSAVLNAHWFEYVSDVSDVRQKGVSGSFDNGVNFKYPWKENIHRIKTIHDCARYGRDLSKTLINRSLSRRPLVKDPIAFFSAEWIHQNFDAIPVCISRHPAAFCSSLKVKDWQFDFDHFRTQSNFKKLLSKSLLNSINEAKGLNIIEQGILLWNIFNHVLLQYKEKYPEWIYIRHEDVSRDPIKEFQILFEKLGLKYTTRVKKHILHISGTRNPSEQSKNEFRRNSIENISNWKHRLSDTEISRIREGTEAIASHFYSSDDW